MEEKEISVPDSKTGKIKTIIEKVPVVKNKVIPKPAGSPAVISAPVAAPLTTTPTASPIAAPVA
jgi:hypothetical protein